MSRKGLPKGSCVEALVPSWWFQSLSAIDAWALWLPEWIDPFIHWVLIWLCYWKWYKIIGGNSEDTGHLECVSKRCIWFLDPSCSAVSLAAMRWAASFSRLSWHHGVLPHHRHIEWSDLTMDWSLGNKKPRSIFTPFKCFKYLFQWWKVD